MQYTDKQREQARALHLGGATAKEIAAATGASLRTVQYWRGDWPDAGQLSAQAQIEARLQYLLALNTKDGQQLKEIRILCAELPALRSGMARAERIEIENGYLKEHGVLPAKLAKGQSAKGKKRGPKAKNDISDITVEQLREWESQYLYAYQLTWLNAKRDGSTRRRRFVLKSRQIGATYYFAWEAFADAVETGDNQIFLSASRPQAEIFKSYILAFAKDFDLELSGNPIVLSNGAELHFLSTSARTAQGYHGHVYYDEVFWVQGWAQFAKTTSGMAMHKKWRKTYFSTPSSTGHAAYALWTGDDWRKKQNKRGKTPPTIDHSSPALLHGQLGPDGLWRCRVTVEDAERLGCNLFDIEELRDEYTKAEYGNLLMCEFLDAQESAFALEDILAAKTPPESWTDYRPREPEPFGRLPVAIGYDPARVRDDAAVVLCAIPLQPHLPWRVLLRYRWQDRSFRWQVAQIEALCQRFNVLHIGIDTTGPGALNVFENVLEFFPRATPITYSPQTKSELVAKTQEVLTDRRIEYDEADTELQQSLLMVRRHVTSTGVITYAAQRSESTGHADLAWALMHALHYEPRGRTGLPQSRVIVT